MGIVDKLTGGAVSGLVGGLTGQTAADAAREAGRLQLAGTREGIEATEAAREQGLGFLQPFQQIGAEALPQASFLTDPQAQFDFLQQNPLFREALESAQTQTKGMAAARGRLSAGDTLQQLSKNVLLSAQPLISGQKQSIMDLLGLGAGVAGSQANIATGAGADIADLIGSGAAAQAAGEVGAATAQGQGAQNLLTSGLLAGSIFSDIRLKENLNKIGESNGHNIYYWTWNKIAEKLGLSGDGIGVIAQEVLKICPEAISTDRGYMKVNYSMLGV